ncbi:leucine-rich repeat-containing protein [Tanacetum coccineum]
MVVHSKLKELCTHKGIVTPRLKLCVFSKEGGLIPEKVEACLNLLEVDSPELFPCKSALFDGCRFALALRKIEEESMWKVMSQVWIEMLAYAATLCRGFHHEQQLKKGGEI